MAPERRVFLLGLGALAGCAGPVPVGRTGADRTTDTPADGSTGPSVTRGGRREPPGEGRATVTLESYAFDPVRVSVPVGGTVEWRNTDPDPHRVESTAFHDIAADWAFRAAVPPGESVGRRFDRPGVFEYGCGIHGREGSCGVVLVGSVTLDEELPCEEPIVPHGCGCELPDRSNSSTSTGTGADE